MALFKTATLLPHVKLSAAQQAALEGLFEQVSMLVLDDTATALSSDIQALTPEPTMALALMNAYVKLKQFGAEVLSQNVSSQGYSVFDSSRPPLYDREAASGLLAEFQANEKDVDTAAREHNETYRAAALTLLLSEDMLCLQSQSVNVLKNANAQSAFMWSELKGEPDPLNLQVVDIEPNLLDERFVKKRLTAWAILAKIHAVDADVYVTFDRATLEHCLEIFEPGAPFKEATTEYARAMFYLLPVNSQSFFTGLIKPNIDFEFEDNTRVVLAYVGLTD